MQERKQPEHFRCREVAVSFTVSDLERSIAWYGEVLGMYLKETFRADDGSAQGAVFVAGALKVFLTQDDFAKGRDRVKGVGVRLWCSTAQELDQLAEAIKSRGGELTTEPTDQSWGSRDFSLADPDGFNISITTLMES